MDKEQLQEYLKELITELKEDKITPRFLAREVISIEGFFEIYLDYVLYSDDVDLTNYEKYHRPVLQYLNHLMTCVTK